MALPASINTETDTFKVTAYNAATNTATITFVIGGTSYAGVNVKGVPVDSVANVKAYLLNYANAYLAGKLAEQNQTVVADASVAALLNTATSFV